MRRSTLIASRLSTLSHRLHSDVSGSRLPTHRALGTQPEERPTDTHYRRALLDRDWVVPGHSHRKAGAEAFDPTLQSLRQLAQASEGRPSRLRRADQSPDRHEAQQPEMTEVGQGRKLRLQRL